MRYFFHFLAGNARLDDDQGLDHASPAAAKADALRTAREMIADLLRRNQPVPDDGSIEITDARGCLVDCMPLTGAVFGASPEITYRRVFERAPQSYLLLSPDLTIVEANSAYLRATMTDLGSIVRRSVFDVFPDNPGDPEANGVRNVAASFSAVFANKREHVMPVQRYDLRRPDGIWEPRYWKPTNIPLLDANGDVEFILHHAEDVTQAVARAPSRTA